MVVGDTFAFQPKKRMGVNNGKTLLYALAGLTFSQLCSVCRERAKDAGRTGAPAVVCDISWLCYKLLNKKTVEETVVIVTSLILKFVKEENVGFYAAFDPDDGRHYTKKAAFRREFERQESIAACLAAKSKIMTIAQDLREGNFENEQQK